MSSILTIALIYLYKKQSETLADQTAITGKQTQIMENQNTLLESQQSPYIEILFWSIQENEIEVSISNIGKGTASELGIRFVFILLDSEDRNDEIQLPFTGYRWYNPPYNTKITNMERVDWEASGIKGSIEPSETDVKMTADLSTRFGLREIDWPVEPKQKLSDVTSKERIVYEIHLTYETPVRHQETVLFRASVPIKDQTTFEDLLLIIEGGSWEQPDRGVPNPNNRILP